MAESANDGIGMRSFLWLCLRETVRTTFDKADKGASIAGAILPIIVHYVPAWEHAVGYIAWEIPVACVVSVGIVRLLESPFLVYRRRDHQARSAEAALRQTITERDSEISVLKAKPKRSPAEQYRYEQAKMFVERLGEKSVQALRYLRSVGSLNFGTYNPPLPPFITRVEDLLWVYNAACSEGLVTSRDDRLGARTYEIPPAMTLALDAVLYENEEKGTQNQVPTPMGESEIKL
jgi:hypothetical protein